MPRAWLVLLMVVLLAACGAPQATTVAPSSTPALHPQSAAAQTASSYQARTPTIREQELQATVSALRTQVARQPAPTAAVPVAAAPSPACTGDASECACMQTGGQAAECLTPSVVPTPVPVPTPAGPPPDPALVAALDGYLNLQTDGGVFSGAVLVARQGQIILSKGYGQANSGQPNTAQTKFRLGSLTKQFTAMAVLMLQNDGKLNVRDPICRYISDCPDAWQPISIRNLLTHTSGIPNYTDFASFPDSEPLATTPAELVARFRDLPLNFYPDQAYAYGNSNYVLLGVIIERVSGQPWEAFLQQRIFTPLGMTNTGYEPLASEDGHATGYISPGSAAPFHDMSTLYAAGGLYSTVEDMLRWDQALYGEQLLPRPLLATMFTPYKNKYGYGFQILRQYDRTVISHPGLVTGFTSYIGRYVDDRVTIIVLSNMQIAPADQIGLRLAGIVFGG